MKLLSILLLTGSSADASGMIQQLSYWGYLLFPPILLAAFVYHGWFARPKRR